MGPFDAFWHLLNFFAPAIGVGLLAPLLAKMAWRRELRHVSWWQLSRSTTALSALTWLAALIVLGRDGRMLVYGAMLGAAALSLWWCGFGARAK